MADEMTAAVPGGPDGRARIVVGVDGSESSKAALRWAVREARLLSGTVEAVFAWEYPVVWRGWVPPADRTDFAGDARRILLGAVDEVTDLADEMPPVEVRPRAERGNPVMVLLTAAHGARLLVVGHRGRGGFAGALLGSVGYHCVQHAPCPVVVVRGNVV